MQRMTVKLGMVLAMSLALALPVGLVHGLVAERRGARDGVVRQVAAESVDAQHLIGPVLLVPYRAKLGDPAQTLALLPDRLAITGALTPEPRHRGIYEATLYGSHLDITGGFAAADTAPELRDAYEVGPARLVLGVGDIRGIGPGLTLDWQGTRIAVSPGADAPGFGPGVTAGVGALDLHAGAQFRIGLDLRGLGRFDVVPTGRETTLTLQSPWPDPSFYGRFLPDESIDAHGFKAMWQVSLFATDIVHRYQQCLARTEACAAFTGTAMGVALFQPVDLYQQLERSVKYGFLFVGLTVLIVFVYEVLGRLAIHPIQYGLVGLALAMFFLLVTSLGEQIGFAAAYGLASVASVGLIGFYLGHVLRSRGRGLTLTGLLAALYAVLFALVRSEDNALMLGSLALFALLAALMIGTRRVDWYALETPWGRPRDVEPR